ncbi:pimeloyl-ACP methyl ester carboxylesterase [Actinoplanes tereljensis]|uniref:Alpha/beta hydrolase fold n=1 Tax=Paractinoplanes tereljensis TaxID=571912 RepID=A0A919U052_9ACTN|nr:alpha/beta hydrolase [Actinoplanes tereljensis]GIF26945.1 alpha/beta hydrolase fold precursor [Actinoplanes tereljensis]
MSFLDLGGRRLHLRTAGAGGVTVVFEAGLGMSAVCWGLVTPGVAAHARTVVYDRAGIGGSDDGPSPRTLAALADDLGALLASLSGPVVLVGHSWGGPIVRLVASRRVADVRAVVLVDPSDERDDEFFTAATRRRMAVAGPLTRTLAAVGVYRAAARIGRVLPADLYAQFRAENFGRRAARALSVEVRQFLPGLASLRATPPDLGDLPVTIISAGSPVHALSPGRLVVADGAGHNIMFTDPQLVVDEIVRCLDPM